jgi:acyl-CoA synthetase (AMP-forming)/AMP-acid ligase II
LVVTTTFDLVVGDSLRRNAYKYPAKVAVKDSRRATTYLELNQRVNGIAHGLQEKGIGRGDPVALLVGNRIEHIEVLFALAKIGALAIPLDVKWRSIEIASTLGHLRPVALVLEPEGASAYDEAKKQGTLGSIKHEILVGDSDYEKMAKAGSLKEPEALVREEDDFIVMITSGTTGFPKGCLANHRTYVLICINNAIEKGMGPHDTAILASPIYFSHGRNFSLTAIYFGGTLVLHERFEAGKFLQTVEKEKVTYIGAVPTMCERLLEAPDLGRYDLRSLRCISITGGKLQPRTMEGLRKHLTPNVYRTYAATDCGQMAISTPRDLDYKPAAAGRPIWCVDLRIVDDADNPVPLKETGEIICQSALATQGYYRNPEATAESFRDGWFYTGDLGYFDEEGFLYVVGRKKDMIKSGGISVYPDEIETILYTHPDVSEAAVIGLPDPRWGEAVKAVIVLKRGAATNADGLTQFCKERLAPYKVPKSVDIVSSIPRTDMGKVAKEKLRQMYKA